MGGNDPKNKTAGKHNDRVGWRDYSVIAGGRLSGLTWRSTRFQLLPLQQRLTGAS